MKCNWTKRAQIYTIPKDRSVTIADIWDMRRHPDNLAKRIKTK